jgi:signal transduction histidine kinase
VTVGVLTPSNPRRAPASSAPTVDPSEKLLLQGGIWVRWIGVATAAGTLLLDRGDLARPVTAWMSLVALLVGTVGTSMLGRRDIRWARHPAVLMLEACLALAVTVADGWSFYGDHAVSVAALATVWSLGVVASIGVSFGTWAGTTAAAAVAIGRLVGGAAPNDAHLFTFQRYRPASSATTLVVIVITVMVGAGSGALRDALRTTHGQAAAGRARQDMAATLHDGVLQALAYIIRRSGDPDIARVARDADIELRAHLALPADASADTLATAITQAARRAEHQLGCTLALAIDEELRTPAPDVVAALTGAVTEAITNAAKHAEASRVTVFATSDEHGIHIAVTDDGNGFDTSTVPAGGGLDQSLRARMRNAGGEARIKSTLGHGTTVELWAP